MSFTFSAAVAFGTAVAAPPSPVPLIRASDVSHPERWVATKELVRVRRGVLAPAGRWMTLKPWERYLARVHAAIMTHPEITLCHESAAVFLGLPIFGEPAEIHALDTVSGSSRLSGGIRLHSTTDHRQLVAAGDTFVTSDIDTVLDLARSRNAAIALAVADAALRADEGLRVEELVVANECRSNSRGRRAARWVVHRADGRAESPLESVSRACVEWLGFEQPDLQRKFHTDGVTDRCDMWWESVRVAGEADGDLKYDGSLQPAVAAMRNEKARDRRLRHHASEITHWGWADVVRIDPLRGALQRAGVRRIAAESSRELFALRAVLQLRRSTPGETATGGRDVG